MRKATNNFTLENEFMFEKGGMTINVGNLYEEEEDEDHRKLGKLFFNELSFSREHLTTILNVASFV